MSLTLHGLYALDLDGTVIGGCKSLKIDTGTEVEQGTTDGELQPRHTAIKSVEPKAMFDCAHIAVLLAEFLNGTAVEPISIDGKTAGCKFYAQKLAHGGSRVTSNTHYEYDVNSGIIVPRTLSVDHRGDCVLSCEAFITHNGSDLPIITSVSGTLPALPGSDNERYTIGAVTIGSVTFAQITQFSIDFGFDVGVASADSSIYPQHAWAKTMKPTITWTTSDLEAFEDVDLDALAAADSNTTIYLRKRANKDSFVADLTAEHIKINAEGIVVCESMADVSEDSEGSASFKMSCQQDAAAGTDALIVTLASAIS